MSDYKFTEAVCLKKLNLEFVLEIHIPVQIKERTFTVLLPHPLVP